MKIRPYILSEISMGDFTLAGYSVAGEESVVLSPELDVCFDIGKCPREALPVNHVLLTHGHADHSAGLLYYFAQRDFQGMSPGILIAPQRLIEPIEALLHAFGRVEGHVPPYELEGVESGQDVEIRRDLLARAFRVPHVPGSLGYSIVEVRKKLKPEYVGLTQEEIVAIKKQGKPVDQKTEHPLVAYLGDTGKHDFSTLPEVRDARALLIECTFFDDEHTDRARSGRHIHVEDLPEILDPLQNERIILTHVTRRTNLSFARRRLGKLLPADILKRTTFLMSRKHRASEKPQPQPHE